MWELGPSEKEAGVKPTPAGRERLKPRKKKTQLSKRTNELEASKHLAPKMRRLHGR